MLTERLREAGRMPNINAAESDSQGTQMGGSSVDAMRELCDDLDSLVQIAKQNRAPIRALSFIERARSAGLPERDRPLICCRNPPLSAAFILRIAAVLLVNCDPNHNQIGAPYIK